MSRSADHSTAPVADQAEQAEPYSVDTVQAAGWPSRTAPRIAFLLDTASRLEERILRAWIERMRPLDFASERIETIALPSSRRPRGRRRTKPAATD